MTSETLVQVFWERARNSSEKLAVMQKVNGNYRGVLWQEQGRIVELIAGGLLAIGVKAKENIAIMCQTRAEWTRADLAILSLGAASVPLYPTLAAKEVQYLLANSEAKGIFIENISQLDKLLTMSTWPENLRFVILIEGEFGQTNGHFKTLTWQDLLRMGEAYLSDTSHRAELEQRIENIVPSDLASIVYTSGTTGVPKGAMLLHSSIYAVCRAIGQTVGLSSSDLTLSFLPLSHVYERVGGQFFSIYQGMVTAYAESMEQVSQNMLEVRPTVLNGVPRFYEKAYNRIQVEVRKLSKPKQYLIAWALSLGKQATEAPQCNVGMPGQNIYKMKLWLADRLVYSKIRSRFGGKLRVMISGAAPLAEEVHSFFNAIGLKIYEGYGLTETAAPASCNTPGHERLGTVGPPLPGVEIKLAEDGEIMVKGPTVFAGYWKDEAATKAVFKDGWFLTGDIGEIDQDGFLKIKDRKKDIIITSGGKHVAPQYIENLFKGDPLISQILVYGDRRKFISALITLNKDAVLTFAANRSISYQSYGELLKNSILLAAIDASINEKNASLSNFERIKKYSILENDFSIEANELTPTFKIKRKVVTEKYKSVLDSFYDANDLAFDNAKDREKKLSSV